MVDNLYLICKRHYHWTAFDCIQLFHMKRITWPRSLWIYNFKGSECLIPQSVFPCLEMITQSSEQVSECSLATFSNLYAFHQKTKNPLGFLIVWAEQGDEISLQYAGTYALKGDLVRWEMSRHQIVLLRFHILEKAMLIVTYNWQVRETNSIWSNQRWHQCYV